MTDPTPRHPLDVFDGLLNAYFEVCFHELHRHPTGPLGLERDLAAELGARRGEMEASLDSYAHNIRAQDWPPAPAPAGWRVKFLQAIDAALLVLVFTELLASERRRRRRRRSSSPASDG